MTWTTPSTNTSYDILDELKVELELTENRYKFEPADLFHMAARINKKRSFLFVSRVLGKHLAVDPNISLLTGHLLAMRYMEVVHGKPDPRAEDIARAIRSGTRSQAAEWVRSILQTPIEPPAPLTAIGFAETATALGHACFSTFASDAHYIHTTREALAHHMSTLNFEEEHSHATSHRVYAQDPLFFENDYEVLLIDDELTTGKTVRNIIRTLKRHYPMKRRFAVLTILDWRTPKNRQAFRDLEEELEIVVQVVSLVEGVCRVEGTPELAKELKEERIVHSPVYTFTSLNTFLEPSELVQDRNEEPPYLKATGRFGWTSKEEQSFRPTLKRMADVLKKRRQGTRTLVIGTGEFMYLPMKLASLMGDGVSFQSTTRSPIFQIDRTGYPIRQKFRFESPETNGVTNFLYNIEKGHYEDLFILLERGISRDRVEPLLKAINQVGVSNLYVVSLTELQESVAIGGKIDALPYSP